MDSRSSCVVVVTGFGPFRQHFVNSSWEAVKELSKLGLGTGVELHTLPLPVGYREAEQRVTRIWGEVQPQLAVHVGMDTSAKAIFLEQCGKNRGYRDADVRGFRPEGGVCIPGGPEVMASVVSMKKVCKHVAVEGIEAAFSRDAGRYVCDYTFYLSLHQGNGHAALIHVPSLSRWLPASLLGEALHLGNAGRDGECPGSKPGLQKTQMHRFQPQGSNWGSSPLEKSKHFNPVLGFNCALRGF